MKDNYLFFLREYFFPYGCGGCGEALPEKEDAFYGLCAECRNFFESSFAGDTRCGICGKPLITEKEICLSCRERQSEENGRDASHFVKLRTFFPYSGRFRTILGAYKFGKSLGIGNFFTGLLDQCAKDLNLPSIGTAGTAWVPVPPKPGKIKKQGWDQIEYIAKLIAKKQQFPVNRCLKRLPSRNQKELNREERGVNIKGKIICKRQPPRTAILFDDVITTGATLEASASALLEGGAEKVYGISLFYD